MVKKNLFKLGMTVLFLASVVCAVVIHFEPIKYAFTAVAFLMIGIFNTIEYLSNKKRSSLVFSIMFYCFSVSSLAFAGISVVVG